MKKIKRLLAREADNKVYFDIETKKYVWPKHVGDKWIWSVWKPFTEGKMKKAEKIIAINEEDTNNETEKS